MPITLIFSSVSWAFSLLSASGACSPVLSNCCCWHVNETTSDKRFWPTFHWTADTNDLSRVTKPPWVLIICPSGTITIHQGNGVTVHQEHHNQLSQRARCRAGWVADISAGSPDETLDHCHQTWLSATSFTPVLSSLTSLSASQKMAAGEGNLWKLLSWYNDRSKQ